MQRQAFVRRSAGSGNEELIRSGANAVLLLALTQLLGAVELGYFAAGAGAMLFLGRLALSAIDREVSALLSRQPTRRGREQLVLTGQAAVLRLSALVLGIGVATAAVCQLTGAPVSASFIVSVTLGAVGAALFEYGAARRSRGLSHPSAALQRFAMPLTRTALAIGVAVAAPGRYELVLLAFAGATLLFGLPPCLWIERGLGELRGANVVSKLLKRAGRRGIEDAAGALSIHQGTILLVALGHAGEAGVFAVAMALAVALRSSLARFERALRVQAAGLTDESALAHLLARSMGAGMGLALLFVPVVLVFGWWLPPLLGPQLAELPAPLWILAGFAAFLGLEAPAAVACRALGRAGIVTQARMARVAFILVLGLLWIPAGGARAAAFAQVTGMAASLALLAGMGAAAGLRATGGREPRRVRTEA